MLLIVQYLSLSLVIASGKWHKKDLHKVAPWSGARVFIFSHCPHVSDDIIVWDALRWQIKQIQESLRVTGLSGKKALAEPYVTLANVIVCCHICNNRTQLWSSDKSIRRCSSVQSKNCVPWALSQERLKATVLGNRYRLALLLLLQLICFNWFDKATTEVYNFLGYSSYGEAQGFMSYFEDATRCNKSTLKTPLHHYIFTASLVLNTWATV